MALFSNKKKEEKKTPNTKADAQVQAPVEVSTSVASILRQPRITEKTALQMEQNQYTFEVDKRSTKSQIKQAIRAMYKVTPIKVAVLNQRSRLTRRRGRKVIARGYKKAVITLKKGDSIELV